MPVDIVFEIIPLTRYAVRRVAKGQTKFITEYGEYGNADAAYEIALALAEKEQARPSAMDRNVVMPVRVPPAEDAA